MTCVLSAFNFSLLLPIQVSIRPTHTANRCTAVDASAFGTLRYTWVSSAYVCADSPHSATTSNNSAVYNRKSSGPCTEPCGTPHTRYPIDDKRPPKLTRWVCCTRNDLTHSNAKPSTPNAVRSHCRRMSTTAYSSQWCLADDTC